MLLNEKFQKSRSIKKIKCYELNMFELVRKNRHRSVLLACIMLFFMLALGYFLGAFISYCCYYGELSQPDRQHRTVQRTPYNYPQSYSQDYPGTIYRDQDISPQEFNNSLSPQQIYYFIFLLGSVIGYLLYKFIQMISITFGNIFNNHNPFLLKSKHKL
jgi:hypothetical protein